jgi:hypothetical protein
MVGENGGAISNRDLLDIIEKLRVETRDSRHAHANKVQEAIGALELRMDARLRAIEVDIAASAPTTLGPRINTLEREMARLDGDAPGGAPKRINDLEAWKDQMTGSMRTLQIAMLVGGGVLLVLQLWDRLAP